MIKLTKSIEVEFINDEAEVEVGYVVGYEFETNNSLWWYLRKHKTGRQTPVKYLANRFHITAINSVYAEAALNKDSNIPARDLLTILYKICN